MFVKTVSRKHLIAIFGSLLPLVFAAPAQPPDATNFVTHLNRSRGGANAGLSRSRTSGVSTEQRWD
jgi:hypothetical protein